MFPAQMFMQECRLTILVKGRREVWGQVGYYPSCSLPMRMRRACAVKTDCFVTLVISTKTYSGMYFILTEAAVQASSSLIGLWSRSLLRVLKSFQPKQQTQKNPSPIESFPSSFETAQKILVPGTPMCSHTIDNWNTIEDRKNTPTANTA